MTQCQGQTPITHFFGADVLITRIYLVHLPALSSSLDVRGIGYRLSPKIAHITGRRQWLQNGWCQHNSGSSTLVGFLLDGFQVLYLRLQNLQGRKHVQIVVYNLYNIY